MQRRIYQQGEPGHKYGIWNCSKRCWKFDICEDTPMLAVARLYQKIGDDVRKWRFEARKLPKTKGGKAGEETGLRPYHR